MEQKILPRLLDVKGLMEYLTLGEAKSKEFGEEAKAIVRYGRSVRYDRQKIDSFIEEIRDGQD